MYRIIITILSGVSLLLLTPPAVSAENSHSYFELLSSHPATLMARGYRTQAEIDIDTSWGQRPNQHVTYDANQDAARVAIGANRSSLASQVRPGLAGAGYYRMVGGPTISTGNLLFIVDTRWGSGFLNVGAGGLETYKNFQLSKHDGKEDRRIEIRARFVHSDPTFVAKIDHRTYSWNHAGERQPMGREGCPGNPNGNCQVNEFKIQANTWTRYWALVDFDNGTYSFWAADENTPPIKLFDEFPIDYGSAFSDGLNNFWFEYNTSQSRTGPAIYAWFRNFVVMHNVPDVDAIVVQGSSINSAPPVELLPAPGDLEVL